MKNTLTGTTGWLVVWVAVGLSIHAERLHAQESYPGFDRAYWAQQEEAAGAKIRRGAGLGVLGLASIVPTSIMIVQGVNDPQKYAALSVVSGMVSLGAIGHGIGSVGFGRQQKVAATAFVDAYDGNAATVDAEQERSTYRHDTRKTRLKTLFFGAYLSSVAAVLLTNGIVQSVHKQRGADLNSIQIWPYFLAGGVLLPLSVVIVVLSGRSLNRPESLESAAAPAQVGSIAPFFAVDIAGESVFGLSFAL